MYPRQRQMTLPTSPKVEPATWPAGSTATAQSVTSRPTHQRGELVKIEELDP